MPGKKNIVCNIIAGLALILSPFFAAGQDGPETEVETGLEEVVVTGSRLIRSALDSPSPVTVFNASDLVNSGITTVEEFARYLPQNADTFTRTFSVTHLTLRTQSVYRRLFVQ